MLKDTTHTLNDTYLRVIGIPISVLVVLLCQMPYYFPGRWDLFGRYAAIGLSFTVLIWEIARWIILRMRRRFPDLNQTKQRIGWMFLFFVIEVGIGQALLSKMMLEFKWSETDQPFLIVWLVNFASSIFFVIILGGAYEAMYFFSQYKVTLQRAEMLKKQQAQQRLDALKNRVNPHFLFNSLTTLSALISEDAPQAERFVDELSTVYRYLLRAGRQQTATLGEELKFAESYIFLLKNRFETGAFLMIVHAGFANVSNAHKTSGSARQPTKLDVLEQNIPTLSLQNVIDYLVRTQNLPLHIQVETRKDHLIVACEYQPKSLSFDMHDNDWRQLEAHGASQKIESNQLRIQILFTQNLSV